MTSCTIIISHYESIKFLRACIRQIKKYKHEDICQHIIVADQSCKNTYSRLKDEYAAESDIEIAWMKAFYSGYGIDWVIRNCNIESEFICQIHSDVMAVHKNWLFVPITLIQEQGFSFVGQFQFVSDGSHSIYPPEPFCGMSQCFNVARTETYKELSLNAGFTRFHNRDRAALTFLNNDWYGWAKEDYDARGSDDDVVAFHWQDKYRIANKLGLSITGMIGLPEHGSSYGRIIEDLVFHFGSAREAIGVMDKMPVQYQKWTKKINEQGFDDELLNEMLETIIPYKSDRTFWDGTSKVASKANEDLNNRIEQLKK